MKTYKEFMEDSYMKRKIAGQRTARKSKKKREREAKKTKSAADYKSRIATIFQKKGRKRFIEKTRW